MQTNKHTNPFVYVIAAVVIAILGIGLRYVLVELDAREVAIQAEAEIGDYLVPQTGKPDPVVAPTSGEMTTTTGETTTATGEMTTENPANTGTSSSTTGN